MNIMRPLSNLNIFHFEDMKMSKIALFSDGSWEWLDLATLKIQNSGLKYIELTLGEGWLDSEVSRMVKDYYYEGNLSWIFDQ